MHTDVLIGKCHEATAYVILHREKCALLLNGVLYALGLTDITQTFMIKSKTTGEHMEALTPSTCLDRHPLKK